MRIAKLPNGVEIKFPNSLTDEEMDAIVQKYISTTEANVQKYLLNEEALQGIITVSETMAAALTSLNKLITSNQQQQTAMIAKMDDVLKAVTANKSDKLQKAIDVMTNTNNAAFTKIATAIGDLARAVDSPIKFSYDEKGNMTEAR